jgi:hypothetical protein
MEERAFAMSEFIDQYPQGPPIRAEPVPRSIDDFRRHVLCSSDCRKSALVSFQGLGEPEVCYENVSVEVQEDVLGFDVAVDEA